MSESGGMQSSMFSGYGGPGAMGGGFAPPLGHDVAPVTNAGVVVPQQPAGGAPSAELRPLHNASIHAQGGPQIPAQQWTAPAQQIGPTGPTVPRPGQTAFAQVASPNYGAAAVETPILKWGGVAQYGGYGYWLYNNGSIKIVIVPAGKGGVGTVVTRASNKAAYEAILAEFVRLNPNHPQVSIAKALLTGSQQVVSPIATVTTALTAMAQAPIAAMTSFQPSAAAIEATDPGAEPQSWMATIAAIPGKVPWWVWVLGGGAVLVTAAGGAYWMTSGRAKRRENPVESVKEA